jgi:predicted RNase H-like HicB family nuclease
MQHDSDWHSCAEACNLVMLQFTLPIVIDADADGYFVFFSCLQSCYSQGETHEEAPANINDAIRLHKDNRTADGDAPNQTKC